MESIELLHNISNIIINTDSHSNALRKVVSLLSQFLESEVCSIYLLNNTKDGLLLSATKGLHQDAVGKVNMGLTEGLTGQAFSSDSFLIVNDATRHDHFKYFPGIGEEPFNTFIGIPLKSRKSSIGVLVFQFKANRENTPMLEKLLITVSAIVSGLVLKFNLLEITEETNNLQQQHDLVLQGVPLSEGIVIGRPVHVIYNYIESTQDSFDSESEIRDLSYAFDVTKIDLSELITKIDESKESFSSEIFHAHLLMLQDGSFKKAMVNHIVNYNKGAAFAIRHVSENYIKKFRAIPDPYLRERAADVEDICQRLLTNLGVLNKETELHDNSIIISDRLTPGETASLDMEKVCGFITEKDGPTSHTAILARGRQIPAVSGIHNLLGNTESAKTIIIDGFKGEIIVNPSEKTLKIYNRQREEHLRIQKVDTISVPFINSIRKYGIQVQANVSSILDAEKAASLNADGIGLVRTEIFYLQNQGDFEYDSQLRIYQQIAQAFSSGPIVFRLLDIGADKKSRSASIEDNPALGLRGIRLLQKEQRLLNDQVSALLEIGAKHSLKILIPFISEAEEFTAIATIIRKIATEKNLPVPPIGAMIEIPSAVFVLEELIESADFFSVGTNDLFQYFCAVDRNNPDVSSLYNPDSKAFMRLMTMIYEKVGNSDKEIEICGEIAADPTVLGKLLEIGYRHFSVNPYSIHSTRRSLLNWFG
ncbi:MAG: phosphoenolpyruvate--protein phosphotransferase [Deltaproteobacteria bacterium]|nr:phosphoenolpyruvate--protein phosphotransferase [Deltaproteobacteria bacterium]MBT6613556.1 phosphoenolpyruvate--protein phosphotransferase [Deltaproteobacteria bacterium]MBT7154784.1 phosphoenolpyruvate--protein phosphotransferase [Deltaproteobacteria bacterium]